MATENLPGDTAEIPQAEMMLPGFISVRPDGVIADLRALTLATGGLELFVERLFGSGMRFAGLDYAAFLKLLYDADWLASMQGKCAEAKIAAKIVWFPQERQTLYKAVKLLDGGNRAEYIFEPVSLEENYEEPIYGEPGEDGVPVVTGYERKTRLVPTKLDFDEFVADMWLKGVKFGIDADVVRQAIAGGASARETVARYLEPVEGRDAEIQEVYAGLHRDNSPKIQRDGKADLKVFKNRFPQVAKGRRLLRKIPRALGKPGYKVTGEIVEPKMPADLDLQAQAGIGTAVEQTADGEFIVSAMDGFIVIDEHSNSISVTEKIETQGGISARTTGDLELGVDEFIEHGEVQEGRIVKGKHMTFTSDVFGNILSQGGNIRIEGNVAGGRIESQGGDITMSKRVSRAVVRAGDGVVTIHYCEHSTIFARVVKVEHAVNCEIIASEVNADSIEGCVVAAEKIKIAASGERRGNETLVTLLIPDISVFDQRIAALQKEIAEAQDGGKRKAEEINTSKAEPEFAKYLTLHEQIKSGALRLTAEQAGNWRKLMEKHAKAASQLAKLEEETAVLDAAIRKCEEAIAEAGRERDALGGDIYCVIDQISGMTAGQTMKSANGIGMFKNMSGSEIRVILQRMGSGKARIFSADSGSIGWKFKE